MKSFLIIYTIFTTVSYGQEIIISRNRGGVKEEVTFILQKNRFEVEMNSNFLMNKSETARIGKFSGSISKSSKNDLMILINLATETRNQMTENEYLKRSHSTNIFVNKKPISGFIRLDQIIYDRIKSILNNNISNDISSKSYEFNKETKQAMIKDKKFSCSLTLNGSYACHLSQSKEMIYFK